MTFCRAKVVMLGVVFGASAMARADVTYSYVGNYFTDVTAPYTTSDRITGTMTLAEPLGLNQGSPDVQPISFSFTDGVQTLTETNALSYDFELDAFQTGQVAKGPFADWNISIVSGEYPDPYQFNPYTYGIFLQGTFYEGGPDSGQLIGEDLGDQVKPNGSYDYGSNDAPSVFTLVNSSTVTPEPATLALLGTGLVGMVGILRRRLL